MLIFLGKPHKIFEYSVQNKVITQDMLVVWFLLFSSDSCLAQVLEQILVCVDLLGALMGFCKDGYKADSSSAVNFTGSSSSSRLGMWSECGQSPPWVSRSPCIPLRLSGAVSLLESGRKFAPCIRETRSGG